MKKIPNLQFRLGTPLPETEHTPAIRAYFEQELAPFRKSKHLQEYSKYKRLREGAKEKIAKLKTEDRKEQYEEAKKLTRCISNEMGVCYEFINNHPFLDFDVYYLSVLAESMEESDQTIVDAGCGTGLDINLLAKIFPEKQFIGYDISEKFIKIAEERATKNENKNISFHTGDHRNLPPIIEDGSVDLIYMKYQIWEEELIPEYLNEITKGGFGERLIENRFRGIRKALKKGGDFVSVSYIDPSVLRWGEIRSLMPGFSRNGEIYFEASKEKTFSINTYKKD